MSEWNKTIVMDSRLKVEGKLDPNGEYQDRPIIHRDTQIDGGVYLRASDAGEAIVVDSQKYPALGRLYEKARQKATENGCVQRDNILQAVYDTVRETFTNSTKKGLEKLLQQYDAKGDKKIALDRFIDAGTGMCVHKALTCGALLEMFKRDGYIHGKPSIDRNQDQRNGDLDGGHAWCRYTNSKGKIFILDAGLKYIGLLKDAPTYDEWDYRRPGENGG